MIKEWLLNSIVQLLYIPYFVAHVSIFLVLVFFLSLPSNWDLIRRFLRLRIAVYFNVLVGLTVIGLYFFTYLKWTPEKYALFVELLVPAVFSLPYLAFFRWYWKLKNELKHSQPVRP